ncbi:hypothetical protein [Sodalis sp.]|uniref:hypothetical protein n=1 Tax=Sodalis sp. (in: enterobacteria) TaxID=1898979 RepID=UPI003872E613
MSWQATFLGGKEGILIILKGKAIDCTAIDGGSLTSINGSARAASITAAARA